MHDYLTVIAREHQAKDWLHGIEESNLTWLKWQMP